MAYCAALLLAFSCGSADREPASERLKVFVTIPPQSYLVERIGGDYVEVTVLIGPGSDPHVFAPLPRQMARLAESKAYFKTGLPLEERVLERIADSHEKLKIVDTNNGIKFPKNRRDPHVWMNPRLVGVQAANICRALKEIDPAHAGTYERNLKALLADLKRLDGKIASDLSPCKGGVFFVFHPAYGYFADAYGLEQVSVEYEGKEPGSKHLVALIEKAKKLRVKTLLVGEQTAKRAAEAFAENIRAKIVTVNPLARDYLANMEIIAQAIKSAVVMPEGKILIQGKTHESEQSHRN